MSRKGLRGLLGLLSFIHASQIREESPAGTNRVEYTQRRRRTARSRSRRDPIDIVPRIPSMAQNDEMHVQ